MPTTQETPCSSAARTFAGAASGVVKSTAASQPPSVGLVAELDPAHLVPGRLQPRRTTAPPSFPSAPKNAIFTPQPARPASVLARPTAARNRVLVGPDAGRGEPLRRQQRRGELGELVGLDRLDLRHDRSSVRSSVSVTSDFPSRLIRFEVDSSERTIRPLRLSFARSSSPLRSRPAAISRDLLDADLDARGEVLLPRADVDAEDAGVGVLRPEAVDGVRHAALLADLLEEPRRRRPAEDRVEQRRREAAAVRARDAGRAEAEVVLLGLLPLEAEPGPGQLRERPADPRACARGRARAALAALQERDEAVVLEVPRRGDDDVPGRVRGAVVARERAAADRWR